MKVKQISEHIWSLKTWIIIPIHVWLVKEKDGLTLVDAGIPAMAKGILNTAAGLEAGSLKRILLTHGHSDHVGAIKNILKEEVVPVYAHAIELSYMEGELAYPGRKKAAASVEKGITQPLPVDENDRLKPLGSLIPYHTPGHSPGHVAYYHEQDQVLLAGDLFTTKNGHMNRPMPMFTADMDEAMKSSEILRDLKPKHLEVCHGEPIGDPAGQLDTYLEKYKRVPV